MSTKVAILGFGFMGKTHAAAYAKLPATRITAIGDLRTELFAGWKAPYPVKHYSDLEALVREADADILDICLPTPLHEQFVIVGAARGMHILCEKPLALTLTAVDRMLDAVNKAGVSFMVAQVLRFDNHYNKIHELVRTGVLGEVFFASAARLSQPPQWAAWFRDPAQSGGALFDLQIHDLDYLLSVFGQPVSLFTTGVHNETGCWNQVVNVLSYPDKKAMIEATYMMPVGWPFSTWLRVQGTEGSVEHHFRSPGDFFKEVHNTLTVYRNGQPPEQPVIVEADPYVAEIEYFVECVAEGRKPVAITPEESRNAIRVVLAAKQSLETGQPVSLDQASATSV